MDPLDPENETDGTPSYEVREALAVFEATGIWRSPEESYYEEEGIRDMLGVMEFATLDGDPDQQQEFIDRLLALCP